MTSEREQGSTMQLERDGAVAIITMNNPPANTWTPELLHDFRVMLDQLIDDEEVRALVLASGSERFFSAGADVKQFADGDATQATTAARAFGSAFETLTSFRGLTVAAINGWAMGGGLEVALACDLRVADETAVMALPEARVGLLPCAGGTQNLTRLVGEGWAKRIILCGERVDASQALQIGLVEEVVGAGEARVKALELAQMSCRQSPASVVACKTLIQHTRSGDHNSALMRERDLFVDLFRTDDQKEGVQAFLEKREPNWQNR
ncbi:enoyl-CoA hydratase [Natronospirillum operosum]|uniref:Enoyl-CoA hydratase n=1 Tax=Natronospirillum operosum TaxID=2759953 RepID=A0A4Z0W383_9GAMM|nr:enoyl-CoA hydratase [Natronospirillum operosum]TGG91157.1 enoyl-CoA hydratase [Natronospirillum operosum]